MSEPTPPVPPQASPGAFLSMACIELANEFHQVFVLRNGKTIGLTAIEKRLLIQQAMEEYAAPLLAQRDASIQEQAKRIADLEGALREAMSLAAFLHGAFNDQLRPQDRERLTAFHVKARATLAATQGGHTVKGVSL